MRGFFYFYKMDIASLKREALEKFWGFNSFRQLQEEIVDSVLSGQDTLALLPTGGGKSLCYQLPALISEGTCLVISPLLALMNDQVQNLKSLGIEAEYISAELEDSELENIFYQCKLGITKLLYVSPERLTNKIFLANLEEIQISFIAVDEAHCISEWGQDFRPSYQNIRKFREEFANVPILALTATATPAVLKEIDEKLGLRKSQVFQQSFRRDNLKILVNEISDKYEYIYNYLKYSGGSGIIYTRTRKEAEELCNFLQNNAITNVDYYHAGLSPKEKKIRQKKWTYADNFVLISTNAFGMGIDKENVRFVIHYSSPASIENYYQEIGRAGRDGKLSDAIILWNKQEIKGFDDILRRQVPDRNSFINIVSYLYSCCQIADGDESQETFEIQISRIQNFTKAPLAAIRNVLQFLNNQDIIYFKNQISYSSAELLIKPADLELLSKKDAYFVELLLRTLEGIQSKSVVFGENALSKKIGTTSQILKERLKELHQKNILKYIDGEEKSVKFIKPRNDIAISKKLRPLFDQIQKNKLQKWEEMKFFLDNNNYCKMKLILAYFGENNVKTCGKCSICTGNQMFFAGNVSSEIKQILSGKPSGLEEIAIRLAHYKKELLLENLILLLDSGEVAMQDFRTYRLA